MVANVRRADVVVKPIEDAVWSVDRAEGPSKPSPIGISKVWNRFIRVLQPCVQDEPEVDPHVWEAVVDNHWCCAECPGCPSEARKRKQDAKGGERDASSPLRGEELRARSEVISGQ